MSKKFLYLTIIGLLIFNPCLKAEGLVAVFVNGDKTVKDEYKKLLQSEMEEGLVECSYSIVEHNEEYLEMVRAYNDYLKGSSVSEFAFDEIESEKLADMLCVLYIRKLSEGSYRIEVTLTKYGQTDSKMKKSYPSLGEAKCNIDVNPNEKIKIATIELLYKLELISSERRNAMIEAYKIQKEELRNLIKKNKCKENGKALAASVFLPGLGQMIKGHGAEGAFTLIGELGLIGGGVATYYVAKNELELLKAGTLDLNGYNTSTQKYNDMRIVTYTLFAAAGALYVFNLCRAYLVIDKKNNSHLKNLSFHPAILPTENQQIAMGVGMTINF